MPLDEFERLLHDMRLKIRHEKTEMRIAQERASAKILAMTETADYLEKVIIATHKKQEDKNQTHA